MLCGVGRTGGWHANRAEEAPAVTKWAGFSGAAQLDDKGRRIRSW